MVVVRRAMPVVAVVPPRPAPGPARARMETMEIPLIPSLTTPPIWYRPIGPPAHRLTPPMVAVPAPRTDRNRSPAGRTTRPTHPGAVPACTAPTRCAPIRTLPTTTRRRRKMKMQMKRPPWSRPLMSNRNRRHGRPARRRLGRRRPTCGSASRPPNLWLPPARRTKRPNFLRGTSRMTLKMSCTALPSGPMRGTLPPPPSPSTART
mmetsp:Transcript_2078/g.4629  ORF Transcript_2078/g.4629 Transcript_2078/m.4629 type:complete len:206 (+) Transcript_2078:436-1053(+)